MESWLGSNQHKHMYLHSLRSCCDSAAPSCTLSRFLVWCRTFGHSAPFTVASRILPFLDDLTAHFHKLWMKLGARDGNESHFACARHFCQISCLPCMTLPASASLPLAQINNSWNTNIRSAEILAGRSFQMPKSYSSFWGSSVRNLSDSMGSHGLPADSEETPRRLASCAEKMLGRYTGQIHTTRRWCHQTRALGNLLEAQRSTINIWLIKPSTLNPRPFGTKNEKYSSPTSTRKLRDTSRDASAS